MSVPGAFKLGVHLRVRTPEEALQELVQARSSGFSCIQITFEGRNWRMGDFRHLHELVEDMGVDLVAIGCYVNPLRPTDVRLTSVDWSLFQLVTQFFPELAGKGVVVWSGTHSHELGHAHPQNRGTPAWESFLGFLRQAVPLCQQRGARLLVELHRAHVLHGPGGVERLFAEFDRAQLGLVLDPAGIVSGPPGREWDASLVAATRSLARWVDLVHLADLQSAPGGRIQQVSPGDGVLDFGQWMAELRKSLGSVPWIVESCPTESWPRVRRFLDSLS